MLFEFVFSLDFIIENFLQNYGWVKVDFEYWPFNSFEFKLLLTVY